MIRHGYEYDIKDLIEKTGLKKTTIYSRIEKKWTPQEILERPYVCYGNGFERKRMTTILKQHKKRTRTYKKEVDPTDQLALPMYTARCNAEFEKLMAGKPNEYNKYSSLVTKYRDKLKMLGSDPCPNMRKARTDSTSKKRFDCNFCTDCNLSTVGKKLVVTL